MEKIGIIDIGSNSARLVLVNVLEGGFFVVFDELKENIRLGQDLDWNGNGFIKPHRIDQTIKTLTMFRKLCEANKVDRIYAYATSAVRRAKNQKSFLDEVTMTCGIKIKVLSVEEHTMLIYNGVINSMDISKGFVMEMGGGSTTLFHYNRRSLINSASIPYGTVSMTDMVKGIDDPVERNRKIEEFMAEEFSKIDWLKNVDKDATFIGIGGAFRNLGRISRLIRRYPINMTHNYEMSMNDFKTIHETISKLDINSTMQIKGLSQGRADIFPSALSIMNALFKNFSFNSITIGGCGLREGAMFRHASTSVFERPIPDILGHSLYTHMKYFDVNIQHAEHVYDLAMQLYRQIRVLHKMPRNCQKILRTAALLSDSGMRIKFYNHKLHSGYIILNSNIYGLTHKEMLMAAIVVQGNQTEAISKEEIIRYRELINETDITYIKQLNVLLRIAKAFDRSMSQAITDMACDVLGDSVIIKTEQKEGADCSIEIKTALTTANDFKNAFGKGLEIL